MSLLAVPAGEPGTIGAALAARPKANAAFAFFPFVWGKASHAEGALGLPLPSSSLPARRSLRFPAHPLGSP